MSDNLVKKYKYIGEESSEVSKPPKIYKDGNFSPLDYKQFDSEVIKNKNIGSISENSDQNSGQKNESFPVQTQNASMKANTGISNIEAMASEYEGVNAGTEGNILEIEQQIKAEFESRLKSERESAYQQGIREGKSSAVNECEAQLVEARRIFANIESALEKQSEKYFEEISKIAMDMSVHLARKIVGDAVTMIPDIIKTNVDKCVSLLAGSGMVEIKINAADYDIVKAYLPGLEQKYEGKYNFVMEPDPQIERGGCLIEFDGSTIDGRIETQFEKLKQQMEMIS